MRFAERWRNSVTGKLNLTPSGVPEAFYASKVYRDFRFVIIAERGLTCEHCGGLIAHQRQAHVHHIMPLSAENWQDATVALNPDNVMIVHQRCHNTLHPERSAAQWRSKRVFIVYGMPLSGKTSYVLERKERYDIVLDMDSLYQAITFLPKYDKPDALFTVVRSAYNDLLDRVKTRSGKWRTAWVIGGFADKYQREKLAEDLGAEVILMECTREEALERLRASRPDLIEEYTGYINKWIERWTV